MFSRVLALCAVLTFVGILAAEDVVDYAPLPASENPAEANVQAVPQPIHDIQVTPASTQLTAGLSPEKAAIIEQKLRKIGQLQSDIDRLRRQVGANRQIVVHFAVLEVSLDKLDELGVKWPGINGEIVSNKIEALQHEVDTVLPQSHKSQSSSDVGGPLAAINCLGRTHAAEIIAEPTIALLMTGRPASLFVGGDQNANSESPDNSVPQLGTSFDVSAIEKTADGVQLNVRIKNIVAAQNSQISPNKPQLPRVFTRMCDTTLDLTYGKPLMLDGMTETLRDTADKEHRSMLVFVVVADRPN